MNNGYLKNELNGNMTSMLALLLNSKPHLGKNVYLCQGLADGHIPDRLYISIKEYLSVPRG